MPLEAATVNVSFPKRLLQTMDRIAKEEARSRSELLREAVRSYVQRKRRWEQHLSFWSRQAARAGIQPEDVEKIVSEGRARRSS